MTLQATAPPHAKLGQRCIAVLIGIDAYQSGVPMLRNAVHDVESVAKVLQQDHGYEVRLLRDAEATLAGIRSLLSALPADLDAMARLILYFAGQGIVDE